MGHFLATRAALYHASAARPRAGARARAPGQARCRSVCPDDPDVLARDPRRAEGGGRPAGRSAAGRALRPPTSRSSSRCWRPGRLAGLLAVGAPSRRAPAASEDLDFAAALVRQAQAALEGARLHRLALEKERQDRDLEIARGIQQGLLPEGRRRGIAGFEVAGESRSCLHVGGDYYDYVPLAGDRLGLVIADVSGKGTPASLMMASVHAWLRALAGSEPAARVLERLNRFVYASTETSRYVTLFYAELDPATRRLVYVNAGHVPPFVVRAGGGEERLRCGGPVLGLLDEVTLEPGELTLEPGDLLVAVTDGVTEAMDPTGREFGDERVRQTLAAHAGRGRGRDARRAHGAGGRLGRPRGLQRRPDCPHPEGHMTKPTTPVQHADRHDRAARAARPARGELLRLRTDRLQPRPRRQLPHLRGHRTCCGGRLRHLGYEVREVMNVTDVDDRIIQLAAGGRAGPRVLHGAPHPRASKRTWPRCGSSARSRCRGRPSTSPR